nr:unnamed protein product [Callosobruchus analis]
MANMTNEDTFKFFELYQAGNCLWNPKDKYHKNKNVVLCSVHMYSPHPPPSTLPFLFENFTPMYIQVVITSST